MSLERKKVRAFVEVLGLCSLYIGLSYYLASRVDLAFVLPEAFDPPTRSVGAVFLIGALAQLGFVGLLLAVGQQDVRRAGAATFQEAGAKGWSVALLATAIQALTVLFVVLESPRVVFESSTRNLLLSVVAGADGWSQEMMFRGFVLFRLQRAEVAEPWQILISGATFSAIHVGYADAGFGAAVWPLAGTFVLGCFYAWSVLSSHGSLRPVVVCHVLLIVLLQPWLALAS